MASGLVSNNIARWNGQAWLPLGQGVTGRGSITTVNAIQVLSGGDLLVSGTFASAGGVAVSNIARWHADTGAWSAAGAGVDSSASAMCRLPNGDFFIGGSFSRTGSQAAPYLVRLSIRPVCAPDYNCSGTLEVQDIFDYLNAWFAGEIESDFDGNGTVEVQDIFDFLNAWFAGCG
jgi:hypothetical protein